MTIFFRHDESYGVPVCFRFCYEIYVTFSIAPKWSFKTDEYFVDNSVSHTLKFALITLRHFGLELYFSLLENSQRKTGNHILTPVYFFISKNSNHFSWVFNFNYSLIQLQSRPTFTVQTFDNFRQPTFRQKIIFRFSIISIIFPNR